MSAKPSCKFTLVNLLIKGFHKYVVVDSIERSNIEFFINIKSRLVIFYFVANASYLLGTQAISTIRTKYEIDLFKCIFCGFCEESCPVDSIVETRVFDYHFEEQGAQIMTKEKLLEIGHVYEAQLAQDIESDAKYR